MLRCRHRAALIHADSLNREMLFRRFRGWLEFAGKAFGFGEFRRIQPLGDQVTLGGAGIGIASLNTTFCTDGPLLMATIDADDPGAQ